MIFALWELSLNVVAVLLHPNLGLMTKPALPG